MRDNLTIYLHDHLSASKSAVDLLNALKDHHREDEWGPFAASLLSEIESERSLLESLVRELGGGKAGFKEAAGWIAAKAGRLKLHNTSDAFGVFEALELLLVGISGKAALWRALQFISRTDARLQGKDYPSLIAAAERQSAQVEDRRIAIAPRALAASHDVTLSEK